VAKIVLVHGFNVRDGGASTVDKLAPYLEAAGHEVETDEADYGYYSLLKVRLKKHSAVLRIAGALEDADVIISHSNGSNYANKALKLLSRRRRYYREIRLSPALNRKTSTHASKCWVFHTKTDWAVRISSFIPFHPWGRQGAYGYKNGDTRMENIDCTDIIKRHSDWFIPGNAEWTAKFILDLIDETCD